MNFSTSNIVIPIGLLVMVMLLSCKSEEQQLAKYIKNPDNGLVKTIKVGNLQFNAQYLPQSYQARLAGQGNSDKFLGHQYCNLQIKPTDPTQTLTEALESEFPDKHEHILNRLQFHIQNDLRLSTGSELLPCVLYHALPLSFKERGMEFLLVFRDGRPYRENSFESDLILEFNDRHITTQNLRFQFSKQDLNRIPTLAMR